MPTRLRPSPAFIIAGLALFVAISGTAYATVTINGRSIADHSIPGRKLINNTLTGAQIKESRLATVPKAANASTVGGVTVRKVFYAPTTNSSTPKTILHLGGLVLSATCTGGNIEVVVTSTADHAHLSSEMWNSAMDGNADGYHHADFGPNSASRLESLTDGNAWAEVSFTYTRAGGIVVNGQLSADSTNLNTGHPGDNDIFNNKAKCLVSGLVMSTTAAP